MPIVERVRWRPFVVPFTAEFRASYGTLKTREGLVVEVLTDAGVRGLGEASPLSQYSGGSVIESRALLSSFARSLVGEPLESAWGFDATSPAAGAGSTPGSLKPVLAALQCAGADALGRALGVPVAAVLSERITGERHWETAPVAVNGLIGDGDPEAAALEAARLVGEGFRTLKLKVGHDHAGDLARLEAVRAVAGPAIRLRLDANGALSGDEAVQRLRDYAAFDIDLVEQPVAPSSAAWAALARVRRATGVRLAADESIRSAADFESLRAEESAAASQPSASAPLVRPGGSRIVDAVVIKPMLLGLAESLAVIRGCGDQPALDVVVTTSFDAGLGVAMAAHLAAAVAPALRLPCGLDTLRFLEHSLVRPANANVSGGFATPVGPGLGVEIDQVALERYATGRWEEVAA